MNVFLTALVFALLASPGETATTSFGVAADSHGDACIAIEGRELANDTELTIVDPGLPQQVFAARVLARVPECDILATAQPPGTHYRVNWEGRRPDSPFLGIAVIGALRIQDSDGTVTLELSEEFHDAQVRSCSSREGVHLSAWSGTPLKSRRLWHLYWYVGYEIEPSCEDADFRDEGG